MQRTEWIELHDHPKCPAALRDLFTDALQAVWEFSNSYGPILPRLRKVLAAASATKVLDLCSGGGGPWERLSHQLELEYQLPVHVCLSDKYPNRIAFERARLRSHEQSGSGAQPVPGSRIGFTASPVDATHVPASLCGFRTMFSSFHHFGPTQAREILRDAMVKDRGIAVFELARRDAKTLLAICMMPFLVMLLTPRIRPFLWSRLLWTYLVPVVPMAIGFDGLVSCFRAYGLEELEEMRKEMEEAPGPKEYCWELGVERTGFLPVTFLIGYPSGAVRFPELAPLPQLSVAPLSQLSTYDVEGRRPTGS